MHNQNCLLEIIVLFEIDGIAYMEIKWASNIKQPKELVCLRRSLCLYDVLVPNPSDIGRYKRGPGDDPDDPWNCCPSPSHI